MTLPLAVEWTNQLQILRSLYADMWPLCSDKMRFAKGLAGVGALFFIAFRVWKSLAAAEPIEVFPLLRPFVLGLCIMAFPTLVLGPLNGLLSPSAMPHRIWSIDRRSIWKNTRHRRMNCSVRRCSAIRKKPILSVMKSSTNGLTNWAGSLKTSWRLPGCMPSEPGSNSVRKSVRHSGRFWKRSSRRHR